MKLRMRDGVNAMPLSSGQYALGGGIGIGVGLLLFLATAVLIQQIAAADDAAGARSGAAATACAQGLTDLGFAVQSDDRSISGRIDGLDAAAVKLGRASAAALLCPGWRMSRFCMGERCELPNSVWIELRPL